VVNICTTYFNIKKPSLFYHRVNILRFCKEAANISLSKFNRLVLECKFGMFSVM